MKIVEEFFKADGWKNILTGLGMANKDKRTGASIDFEPMTEPDSEHLYAADEMARKIVDILPKDMLREGFRLVSPDVDDDVLEQAMKYFEDLVLTEDGNKIGEAMIWGRLYGGAGLVIGAEDGTELEEPLDLERLQAINHFTLLNRWELIPQEINGNPKSKNFGYPEFYTIQPRVTDSTGDKESREFASSGVRVHYTRIVRFEGSRLPRIVFIQNQYWHDSILNKLQESIRDYQTSFASATALIQDFAQAIYKVKNLANIISSPKGLEDIQKRIGIIELSRSVLRAAIVDADGEDFERKTTTLAGLDKVLEQITGKFTSSTEYPHTILLGESPSGLGATGHSEKQDYFELVRREQDQTLKPKLLRIFNIIFASKTGPTSGRNDFEFDIEFEPLKHLDQKEMIEARKQQAESDKIYIETGAVDPDEIALSRFGTGEYSFETEINEELRDITERDEEPDPDNPNPEPNENSDRLDGYKKRKKGKRSRKFAGKRFK